MPNDAVVFSRGLAATMPSNYIEGRFLLQTDTGALFLDDTTSSRIQIKDTTKLPLDGSEAMTGNLNLGSHKITNLATPTARTDAATKAYVDNAFGSASISPNVANNMLFGVYTGTATSTSGVVNVGMLESTEVPVVNSYIAILATNGLSTTAKLRFNSNNTLYSITNPNSSTVGAIPAYSNCYALCLFKVAASSLLFLGSLTCIDDGLSS